MVKRCPVETGEPRPKDNDTFVNFKAEGDEVELIDEILNYIPTEREDLWSFLCYLKYCVNKTK